MALKHNKKAHQFIKDIVSRKSTPAVIAFTDSLLSYGTRHGGSQQSAIGCAAAYYFDHYLNGTQDVKTHPIEFFQDLNKHPTFIIPLQGYNNKAAVDAKLAAAKAKEDAKAVKEQAKIDRAVKAALRKAEKASKSKKTATIADMALV